MRSMHHTVDPLCKEKEYPQVSGNQAWRRGNTFGRPQVNVTASIL